MGERCGRDGSVDPLRDIEGWEMRRRGRSHVRTYTGEIWRRFGRVSGAPPAPAATAPKTRRELTREWPRSGAVVRSGNDFDLIVNTLAAVFIVDIPALAYKALLRHFRDASKTRPRHFRDISEAL